MSRTVQNPWLHRFAVFTAVSTLALITLGGLVTSHGVGMAVPDWPTTYGYNMFLFPISQWVGGIFYEHTHRLVASFVGLLTTILAAWLWLKEERRWLRWLGVAAFVAVVVQGLLGGFRVTLFKEELGIFHATLAQIFLVMLTLIALFTSAGWLRLRPGGLRLTLPLQRLLLAVTALILLQLIIGAAMRHQHAGLAVPDFPLAYGKVWPPTEEAFLHKVNQQRVDARDFKPVTAGHIHLHMAHRIGALLIVLGVAASLLTVWRQAGSSSGLTRLALVWSGLIAVQVLLGAATVWSNKAADVATAHVAVGALSLLTGSLLCAVVMRWRHETAFASDRDRASAGLAGTVHFPAAPQRT